MPILPERAAALVPLHPALPLLRYPDSLPFPFHARPLVELAEDLNADRPWRTSGWALGNLGEDVVDGDDPVIDVADLHFAVLERRRLTEHDLVPNRHLVERDLDTLPGHISSSVFSFAC